jgi:hypothetical protein
MLNATTLCGADAADRSRNVAAHFSPIKVQRDMRHEILRSRARRRRAARHEEKSPANESRTFKVG